MYFSFSFLPFQVAYSRSVSHAVSSSLLAAYRESSNKQWQYAWSRFQRFLKDEDILEITKSVVLDFLDHVFKSTKFSPKTIQVYKGALALPLKIGFDIDTGDEEFSLLIRSFFIARPPIKRLPPKWSLNTVLSYISNSDDDSEEFLLQKTLFLVALATGNRASDISAMVRTAIVFES